MKCIYCGKSDGDVTFCGEEHVVPRLLWRTGNNLTLENLVCDVCNSKTFSALETKFKEDTEEGIYCQMLNLNDSCQVRILGKNVKSSFAVGFGESFLNKAFPFLHFKDGRFQAVHEPQIKVNKYGAEGYIVLRLAALSALKAVGNSEYRKIKELFKGVKSKDVRIFAEGKDASDAQQLNEAIDLLKDLGVDYKEGSREFSPPADSTNPKQIEVSLSCTVGHQTGRVIAKIAFNYFAYCALQGGLVEILDHANFSKIKAYVLAEIDPPIKEIIADLGQETLVRDEKIRDGRFVGHTLIFLEEEGQLVAHVSFFGRMIYKVILGVLPDELKRSNFGSGHIFNPIDGSIHPLTTNPGKWGSGMSVKFGLFNKS